VADSPFVDAVRHHLVSEGWVTARTRLNDATVVVRALREDGRGPDRVLVMVVDDPDAAVVTDHVARLVAGAERRDAAALLTSLATITDRAHRAADARDVAVVEPSVFRDSSVETTVLEILEADRREDGDREGDGREEGDREREARASDDREADDSASESEDDA